MDSGLRATLTLAAVTLLVGAGIGAGAAGLFEAPRLPIEAGPTNSGNGDPLPMATQPGLDRFETNADFEAYFRAAERSEPQYLSVGEGMVARGDARTVVMTEVARQTVSGEAVEESTGADTSDDGDSTRRHSDTNVQEAALDEPDVLKTDGQSVYYGGYHYRRGAHETTVLDIEEPAEPSVASVIPAGGELLLIESSETLVVFEQDRLWGYDVSDPSDPTRLWDHPLDATLQTARLYNGSLYLVLVDRPDVGGAACPLEPLGGMAIECTSVYRPGEQADTDAVYTAARLDPTTGEMVDHTSVVGSVRDSATYVSERAIYLSYTRRTSEYDLQVGYLTGPGADHLPAETVDRIETLESLDISARSKAVELRVIIEDWLGSLDTEARGDVAERLQEGLRDYAETNQRNLTRTGIVRIPLDGTLRVSAAGEVPGYPLNQWSMDEYDGHLRIATTIPRSHGAESENDIYVLDTNLTITGSVTGLGETERIYAVRFRGDEGYVVTFRQTDPFYALDLSDPTDPVVEGELKIPGFSSYLHPLDDDGDLVLGVGEQDGHLKLSLFDASDPTNPTEVDVVLFENERFSEAVRNHRAFLQDKRHDAFFLPGGERSYVYSYGNGTLTREASVDVGGRGVRSMYVEDYLYVIGPKRVVVLDETTWTVERRIDLR